MPKGFYNSTGLPIRLGKKNSPNAGFQKGHKVSKKMRRAMHLAHLGKKQSQETIEKRAAKLRGRKRPPYSKEWKEKMSLAKKGKPSNSSGKHWKIKDTSRMGKHMRGENNHFWKGGLTKKKGYRSFMQTRRELRKKGNGGSHTLKEWEDLKAKYNHTCPCCKRSEPEVKLTIDHILPISMGGLDSTDNIQPLCSKCNGKKFNRTIKYEFV